MEHRELPQAQPHLFLCREKKKGEEQAVRGCLHRSTAALAFAASRPYRLSRVLIRRNDEPKASARWYPTQTEPYPCHQSSQGGTCYHLDCGIQAGRVNPIRGFNALFQAELQNGWLRFDLEIPEVRHRRDWLYWAMRRHWRATGEFNYSACARAATALPPSQLDQPLGNEGATSCA